MVGGGPVGLFAATLLRLHGFSVRLVESLPVLGGQAAVLYPDKAVYDVAGFPEVSGRDLAEALVRQASGYAPEVVLGAEAVAIEGDPRSGFAVATAAGTFRGRVVLLTIGIGAFTPRRLAAEGAAELEGRRIHYLLPPADAVRGRRVVVVGGGDTAVDWVLALAPLAREVVLVHRRTAFRAQGEMLRRAKALGPVRVVTPYEVRRIAERPDGALAVTLEGRQGAEPLEVAADVVVGGLGYQADPGPARHWDVGVEGAVIPVDPATMETRRTGIYAAGDVAAYPGKVRLLATGFGEVGIAAAAIRRRLRPETSAHLPHSTSVRGRPAPVDA